MKEESSFDYESFKKLAADQLRSGKDLLGNDGVFAPLLKDFLEAGLEGELEDHLCGDKGGNRKNGKGRKRVKTSVGEVDISTPRDRDSSFSPQLVPKRERSILGLDQQILFLYARGASYDDIRTQLLELYGVETSTSAISRVTDKVLPLLQEWRSRPLEAVYPFVWLDAIHYKVREEGRVISKAVYCVIGVNQDGIKDLLGMYIGQNESSRFWLQVLTDLQNRGVEDIFIACIDNLSGFADAIESIFPQTEVQLCIIHQVRNSTRFLAWKDMRAFMKDLKLVYKADTEDAALAMLDKLEKVQLRLVAIPFQTRTDRQKGDGGIGVG